MPTVPLTLEEIKTSVYNKTSLVQIRDRVIPEKVWDEDNDSDIFLYHLPARGWNGATMPNYVQHAKSPSEYYNVVVSETELDADGFPAFMLDKDVKGGDELIVKFDQESDELWEASKSKLDELIEDDTHRSEVESNGGSARLYVPNVRSNTKVMKEYVTKKRLIDNMNKDTMVMVKPSQLEGVGLFLMEGKLFRPGENPMKLPEECQQVSTVDLIEEDIQDLPNPARLLIERFIHPHYNSEGSLCWAVPRGGPNEIDISHYMNTSDGTSVASNVYEFPGVDTESGFSELKALRSIEQGEELLLNYAKDLSSDSEEENEDSDESRDEAESSEEEELDYRGGDELEQGELSEEEDGMDCGGGDELVGPSPKKGKSDSFSSSDSDSG